MGGGVIPSKKNDTQTIHRLHGSPCGSPCGSSFRFTLWFTPRSSHSQYLSPHRAHRFLRQRTSSATAAWTPPAVHRPAFRSHPPFRPPGLAKSGTGKIRLSAGQSAGYAPLLRLHLHGKVVSRLWSGKHNYPLMLPQWLFSTTCTKAG